jgi:hypothetical protein
VAESGPWKGTKGRIFHLRLHKKKPKKVEVLYSPEFPLLKDRSKTKKGDNFEGLACKKISKERVLVLLGERGGSPAYETGFIRWGYYNPEKGTLEFSKAGEKGVEVSPPSADFVGPGFRSITSLHLTKEGELWTSAAYDPGDLGPFKSLIYRIGTVDATSEEPLKIEPTTNSYNIPEHKVESISKSHLPASKFSFATEDETLGGIWGVISIK